MLSQPFDLVGCVLSTPGGVGIEGAAVVVRDASKKPPVSVGSVTTDERGVFRLALDTAQLALPGCDGCHAPPRLVFEVQKGGKAIPPHAREVLWKVVPHAPPEFEEVASALAPRLGATSAHALDAAEVRDLACATKLPHDRVARFARAARFAERTGLLPEVFYALLGGAPDAPLSALLSADVATWKLRLRAAVEQRQIVLPPGLDVEAVAAQLRGAAVREKLRAPGTLDPSALARVLATALPNAAQREELLTLMAAHQGEPAAFWTALAANETFGTAVPHMQAALQFSALAGGHAPLVEVLQQQRVAGTIPTLRSLASWDHADWMAVLQSSPTPGGPIVGAPLYIEATTEEERQDRYADTLMAAMEVAFPSAFVAARYAEEAAFPGQGDVVKFLSEQEGFELTETNFEDYVEATPGALVGITDVALLKANVEKTQRLYKLAPAYSTMKALSDEGYGACEQIAREDIDVFAAKTSAALGGAEVAYELHNQATVISAAAMTIVAQLQGASPASTPAAVPSRPASVPGFPGYAALFGEGDYCACEECRSIFGPAAYLVDLLEFLRSQPAGVGTAKDALFARRADIGRVALTCDNTRKRVPYVDLVNEILERAVAAPTPALPASIETAGSEAERAAEPQRIEEAAYTTLRTAPYPFTLPFDLSLEKARAWIAERGATRLAVMESVTRTPAAPSAVALAGESLGLTKRGREIVLGESLEPVGELWGLAPGAVATAVLASAATVLQRAGLAMEDLVALCAAGFVAGGDGPVTLASPTGDLCDPSQVVLEGLTDAKLTRMVRFERLRRALGWSVGELDQTLAALPEADRALTTPASLVTVARVARLSTALKVPPVALLGFWFDLRALTVAPGRTLYQEVFQNGALRGSLRPGVPDDFDRFGAATLVGTLAERASFIAAALSVSRADLDALIAHVQGGSPTAPELTHDTLGRLYRRVRLARALGLTVADFCALTELADVPPFTDVTGEAKPDPVDAFVRFVGAWRAAELDLPLADYVLFDRYAASQGLRPTVEALTATLTAVRDAVRPLMAERPPVATDPDGEVTRQLLLGAGVPREKADIAVEQIRDAFAAMAEPDRTTFFDTWIRPHAHRPDDLRAELFTPPVGDTPALRFTRVANAIVTKQRIELVMGVFQGLVREAAAAHLGVTEALAHALFFGWHINAGAPTARLGDALREETFLGLEAGVMPALPAAPSAQHGALLRMHKAALLLQRLRVPAEQAIALLHCPGVFDLTTVPVGPPAAGVRVPALLPMLLRTVDAVHLQRRHPELIDRLATAPMAVDIMADLAASAGWKPLDGIIEYGQAAELVVEGSAPATITSVCAMLVVAERLASFGVRVNDLRYLAGDADGSAPFTGAVAALEAAVRARHGAAAWLAVAGAVNSGLRERRRDALLARLTMGAEDSNALYARLLIDPEMCSCASTSRVQQALAAVQLFMQRATLGLEPAYTPTREAARRWQVMSRYRVWEAGRKVFFYPENWLEPELRDDKTPFFKELEEELLQSDVTPEVAERAVGRYVEKLHEVASLQVKALYRDPDRDEVHVFAVTRGAPRVWYYRRWVDASYWTAWEKVDVPIGEPMVPVKYNGRMYVFWLEVNKDTAWQPPEAVQRTESALPRERGTGRNVEQKKIVAAWTSFADGAWRTKTVAPSPFSGVDDLNMQRVFLRALPTAREGLRVEVIDPNGQQRVAHWALNDLGAVRVLDNTEVRYSPVGAPEYGFAPHNVVRESQGFYTNEGGENVALFVPDYVLDLSEDARRLGDLRDRECNLALPDVRGVADHYRLVPPSNLAVFYMQDVFVFDESMRSYFVMPRYRGAYEWHQPPSAWLDRTAPTGAREAPSAGASLLERGPDDGTGFFGESLRGLFGFEHSDGDGELLTPDIEGTLERAVPRRLRFVPFHHAHTGEFAHRFHRYGAQGVLGFAPGGRVPSAQRLVLDDFEARYNPRGVHLPALDGPAPQLRVDFDPDASFAPYNWELFFHVPLLVAARLAANQRFAEARTWFHYVFDPTTPAHAAGEAPYWNTLPLARNTATRSAEFLSRLLATAGADPAVREEWERFVAQVAHWRDDPFNPHAVARLRVTAYQKAVVMRYVDALVAWGDQLFREDSMESVSEAAQCYLLAASVLGRRPQRHAADPPPPAHTYETLTAIDPLANAVVRVENRLPAPRGGRRAPAGAPGASLPVLHGMQYFCVPPNAALLARWDTVADRLYKIRHCMNLDGVERQLALFAPPIDPALLVRARAAGLDPSAVIAAASSPPPSYRFTALLQKAQEFCGDVRGFGAALLGAIEKKDAEALSVMRVTHERRVLDAARAVRVGQVEEAKQNLTALAESIATVTARRDFYKNRERVSDGEQRSLARTIEGASYTNSGQMMKALAGVMHAIPEFIVTASITPSASTEIGGNHLGAMHQAMGDVFLALGSIAQSEGNRIGVVAGYDRRAEEWDHLSAQADLELRQLAAQKVAAEIRVAIAERELANHDAQVAHAREVEDFFATKFSGQALYRWMEERTASLYFQSYRMALDLARRAEKAFSFERGGDDTFVSLGHWDSLRKGLLAGERLQSELRRMELAWLDRNRRDHELTKHVSLASLAPAKLLELKLTGACTVSLPESLFDRDYPGHYHRRVKSVSLSIPAVAGPYSGVHCRLALTASRVRKDDSLLAGAYPESIGGDARFATFRTATTSIATSSGQNDSGVFQLDFRDERYLPFEGAGAISEWRIELPQENNDFDLQTVSDVVLHLSYTAREGSTSFRTLAAASLATLPEAERTFARAFSVRRDLPEAWHAFFSAPMAAPRSIALGRIVERLGFIPPGQRPRLVSVSALALGASGAVTVMPTLATEPSLWPSAPTATFGVSTTVPGVAALEATFGMPALTDPGAGVDVRATTFRIDNIAMPTPEDVIVIVAFQRVAP